MAATEQQIAEALQSLLLRSTAGFDSMNDVVRQLESRLGVSLAHKVDFIAQIYHYLLQPPPQMHKDLFAPPPQQKGHFSPPPQHKDHFAPPRNPNFHHPAPSPRFAAQSEGFDFRQPNQSAPPPQAVVAVAADGPSVAAAAAGVSGKASAPKRKRGGPGGLNKLCGVSPELQTIVGQPTMPRTEIVKQLWAYIRKNNLQDPNNKRKIVCNDELRLVFEVDCTDMFKMNKLLAKHIIALEPTKQKIPSAKKLKADAESGSRDVDPVPIVVISEALANFFETDEREMSQAEVLRQMWEYIKVHQLEDPLNSTAILCDAKLQELLGCESVSALGIPEMLAQRHLFRKS